jgi:hypothetical protein
MASKRTTPFLKKKWGFLFFGSYQYIFLFNLNPAPNMIFLEPFLQKRRKEINL